MTVRPPLLTLALCALATGCTCGPTPGPDDAGAPDGGATDGAVDVDSGVVDAGERDARVPPGSDAGPGDGIPREGTVCTPRGWCWETPQPAGGRLNALWSPASGQVLAASSTHMFHVSGDSIAAAAPPTLTPFVGRGALWAAAADDAWSEAFGGLIHFDGTRWARPVGSEGRFASALSGFAGDDLWSVSFDRVGHFDGQWSDVDTAATAGMTLHDVSAIGPREAIVVGLDGATPVVLHAAGSTLRELDAPAGGGFAVFATSTDDIWVGTPAGLERWDGATWTTMGPGILGPNGLFGSATDDVWWLTIAEVAHWNGSDTESFTLEGARTPRSITGTSSTDVWVADADGQLFHYDGSTWTRRFKQTLAPTDLLDVVVGDDGRGWAIGPQHLFQRSDTGEWSVADRPASETLQGLAAVGDAPVLFAADGSYRWDGLAWQPLSGTAELVDACMTSDGTVHGVGAQFATLASETWTVDSTLTPEPALTRIRCLGTEAWASAEPGLSGSAPLPPLYRFDGQAWRREGLSSLDGYTVLDAAAIAEDEGWVIAQRDGVSLVLGRDGSRWRQAMAPENALAVDGSASAGLWLVGELGVARRWDGSAFENHDLPSGATLRWVQARGADARALTDEGELWQFEAGGTPEWTRLATGPEGVSGLSSRGLADAAFAGDVVFAAGDRDESLRLEGGVWTEIDAAFLAHEVEANDDAGVWFLSGSGQVGRLEGAAIVEPDDEFRADPRQRLFLPETGDLVLLVGDRNVLRLEGASFVDDYTEDAEDLHVFGRAPDDLWLLNLQESSVDSTTIWRRGAGVWTEHLELASLVGINQTAAGDTLAVDVGLGVWSREGDVWRRLDAGVPRLGRNTVGSHAYATDAIWALAVGGLLFFDGNEWTELANGLGLGFRALSASPSGTLHAVGDGSTIVSLTR